MRGVLRDSCLLFSTGIVSCLLKKWEAPKYVFFPLVKAQTEPHTLECRICFNSTMCHVSMTSRDVAVAFYDVMWRTFGVMVASFATLLRFCIVL